MVWKCVDAVHTDRRVSEMLVSVANCGSVVCCYCNCECIVSVCGICFCLSFTERHAGPCALPRVQATGSHAGLRWGNAEAHMILLQQGLLLALLTFKDKACAVPRAQNTSLVKLYVKGGRTCVQGGQALRSSQAYSSVFGHAVAQALLLHDSAFVAEANGRAVGSFEEAMHEPMLSVPVAPCSSAGEG